MRAKPGTSPTDVSLLKLLGMFFSPLGMRHLLEPLPQPRDSLETAGVRYRNSLFLFRHIDRHIKRSAGVVLVCFFTQPVVSLLAPAPSLYAAVTVLMLAATVHAGALGFYRQILKERIDKYASILGVEPPADRDEPEEFPRRTPGPGAPHVKATRKLPLGPRRGPRNPG